jgi:hypothetical protein
MHEANERPNSIMKKNSRFLNSGFIVAWSEFADEIFKCHSAGGHVGNRGPQLQGGNARN